MGIFNKYPSAFLGVTILCLSIVGCTSAGRSIVAADTVVVPQPKVYRCGFEMAIASQYDNLSVEVRQMLDDYSLERKKLAAAGKLSLACVK